VEERQRQWEEQQVYHRLQLLFPLLLQQQLCLVHGKLSRLMQVKHTTTMQQQVKLLGHCLRKTNTKISFPKKVKNLLPCCPVGLVLKIECTMMLFDYFSYVSI